jgi:hypothetical protein
MAFSNFGKSTSMFWTVLGGVPRIFSTGLKGSTLWAPQALINRFYSFTPRPYVLEPLQKWYDYRMALAYNNVLVVSMGRILGFGANALYSSKAFLDSLTSGVSSIVGVFG